MLENPYTNQINQLVDSEITEIVLTKENFMLFREALLSHPNRKKIIGEAQLGGAVIYRLKLEIME